MAQELPVHLQHARLAQRFIPTAFQSILLTTDYFPMRNPLAASLLLFNLISTVELAAKNFPKTENYIAANLPFAISHASPRGIPIAICLGQAIVESAWGESPLAEQANNHFGMKKGASWKSSIVWLVDDEFNSSGKIVPSRFRKYNSIEDSFLDYAQNLATFDVYRSLFGIPKTDYRAWAFGLQRCGYASSGKYARLLIEVIETNGLHLFDQAEQARWLAREPEISRNWQPGFVKKEAEKPTSDREPQPEPQPEMPLNLVGCLFYGNGREADS